MIRIISIFLLVVSVLAIPVSVSASGVDVSSFSSETQDLISELEKFRENNPVETPAPVEDIPDTIISESSSPEIVSTNLDDINTNLILCICIICAIFGAIVGFAFIHFFRG